MHDQLPLITTLSVSLALALVLGFLASRLRLPALVGYLVAGIIVSPTTPGFVADVSIASQLAEIGVMLLMFGVGLHFSLADLMSVRKIAVPGAVVQMVAATMLGVAVSSWWGWSLGAGLIFGLSLSVASTVVLLRALEARNAIDTVNGRIAVGWLVVEDLAMVLVLVLLPPLAGALGGTATSVHPERSIGADVAITLGQVGAFIALMLVVGRRVFPWVLWQVARTGSRELFTLCVIAVAVGIAYGSAKLFGVSFALGAFFAGMVMRESEFAHRAAEESLPLRDAFSVLFFVSVGMLFNPSILLEQPIKVLATVFIIVLGKSIAAGALVLLFRYPLSTAITVSASLAQIGEFSFILVGLGVSYGLLGIEGQNLVLAGALISIALNPLVFASVEPLRRWLCKRSALARSLEVRADPLAELPTSTAERYTAGHVVLVGYGRVGQRIAQALDEAHLPYVVAELSRERVEQLRLAGTPAVLGDAIEPATLVQAHVARARMLVIATPDSVLARPMIHTARELNPGIEIVVRTHNDEEAQWLGRDEANAVFFGEHELAQAMVRHVLSRTPSAAPAPH